MDSAWIAGAFGLIGVCVGGGLNAAAAAHAEKGRDASDSRVAARLLERELMSAQAGIRERIDRSNASYPARDDGLNFPAWDRCHLLAARNLPASDWDQLADPYLRFYRIRSRNEFTDYVAGEQKKYLEETCVLSENAISNLRAFTGGSP